MKNITDEQYQFDVLIKQINDDSDLFENQGRLLQFKNDLEAMILISTERRMIIFGKDNDYLIIDADYVENPQDFNEKINAFSQFYQTEKDAAKKHLAALRVNDESKISEQQEVFVEQIPIADPYSQAWLRNPNNASWELHWNNGFEESSKQYLCKDLYTTKVGEFVLHERREIDGREMVQRNLTIEEVKSFVFDRFDDPDETLRVIGIEHDSTNLTKDLKPSTPQEQLVNKVENEHVEFQEGIKNLSKDEMMRTENVYEIMVKNEILHHIREGHINDKWVDVLLESDNVLDDIYQTYTARDSNEFFEHIQSAVSDYVVEHHELSQENDDEIITKESEKSDFILTDHHELLPVETLTADDIRNMKKHKARTLDSTSIKLE